VQRNQGARNSARESADAHPAGRQIFGFSAVCFVIRNFLWACADQALFFDDGDAAVNAKPAVQSAAFSGQIVAFENCVARSGLDDRDGLAFGDHVVDLHQD
jgi:hypothetical protein